MGRLRDAFSWTCANCGKEVETPVHSTGRKLRCPHCGATFDFIATAPLDDMPDDLRGEQAWSGRELPPFTGPSPTTGPPEKLAGPW